MSGRLGALAGALFLILSLSGCAAGELVDTAVETHVRPDGSAERRVMISAGREGIPLSPERAWSLPEPGVSLEGRGVVRGRVFEDLRREGDGMRLAATDRGFWVTYEFADRLEGWDASGGTAYKLVMPGRISEAPGGRVDGGVAIWRLAEGEREEVRASSTYIRWWAVVAAGAALLAGIALVVGGRAAALVRGVGLWLWTGDVKRRE
ncbi:hypothetical protein E0L93_04415 [Rubrobacter taiwanensis]|uniref:DUF3153 domain-containing protein n=1 Tax=Rubrobacter taiwanensis TaxID=185139 RepID=A0A4R1BPD9_9ACTN|nr:hypothetical protein [Rubrobacter taiwanensis]TCJ19401.1 hypothetical protein E0L93_04415 [Rubrobacter taiwanensis]